MEWFMLSKKSRNGGRMTLLNKAAAHDYIMVCSNAQEVRVICDLSDRNALGIRKPITFDELLTKEALRGRSCSGLLIQNVDQLFWYLLKKFTNGVEVIAATVSGDSETSVAVGPPTRIKSFKVGRFSVYWGYKVST